MVGSALLTTGGGVASGGALTAGVGPPAPATPPRAIDDDRLAVLAEPRAGRGAAPAAGVTAGGGAAAIHRISKQT